MRLDIDSLTDLTGWVVNAPSTIIENEFKEYIAGIDNEKSLLIFFSKDDTVRTAIKTFAQAIDVTNYENLIFSIWSRDYGSDVTYRKASQFSYKIKLNATDEFYVKVWSSFSDITIAIDNVTSIDRIEITPLHSADDYIIISEMVAEHEEIPIDILEAVKKHVDYFLEKEVSDGINIGTVNASTGDTNLALSNPDFLDRYGVIKIDDGVNSEVHQVEDADAETFFINDSFDGNAVQNDYTNATVYLQFPTYINPDQNEIRLPGIAIWGIDPEPILRGGKLDPEYDGYSVNNDNFLGRVEGQLLNYNILLDCESRCAELIDIMTRAIRKFIAGEILWINGRKHDIFFTGAPVETRPAEGIDIIPKIQYSLSVEVMENINDRVVQPKTTTINIDVEVNNN